MAQTPRPPPPLSQCLWPHRGSSDQLVRDGRLSVGLETAGSCRMSPSGGPERLVKADARNRQSFEQGVSLGFGLIPLAGW